MTRTREETLEKRRRLKAEYGDLFRDVAALLFRNDPIGINFDENTDEYEPETGTILPRLSSSQSEQDVLHIVHEEFVRWFGADTAGSPERYSGLASELWRLWQGYRYLPPAGPSRQLT